MTRFHYDAFLVLQSVVFLLSNDRYLDNSGHSMQRVEVGIDGEFEVNG